MAGFEINTSDLPLSHAICCKMCFSIYKHPKLLPCLHSFCLPCLQTLCQDQQNKQQVQCPSCQECTILCSEGVEGLQDNTILNKYIQMNVDSIKLSSDTLIQKSESRNYESNQPLSVGKFDVVNNLTQQHQHNGQAARERSSKCTVQTNVEGDTKNLDADLENEICKTETKSIEVENVFDLPSDEEDEDNNIEIITTTFEIPVTQIHVNKRDFPNDVTLSNTEIKSDEVNAPLTTKISEITLTEECQNVHEITKEPSETVSENFISEVTFPTKDEGQEIIADTSNEKKTKDDDVTEIILSNDTDDMTIQSEETTEVKEPRASSMQEAAMATFNNLQQKENLRHSLSYLQSEAINIVHSIDSLNEESFQWQIKKKKIHQQIQERSNYLMEIVQKLKRKLLNELETFQQEQDVLDAMHDGKMKLHGILKNILTIIDFIRMLLDYGNGQELEKYIVLINERIQNLSGQTVEADQSSFAFHIPLLQAEEYMSKLYGNLILRKRYSKVWTFDDSSDDEFENYDLNKVVKSQSLNFQPTESKLVTDTSASLVHYNEYQMDHVPNSHIRKDLIQSHNLSPRHVAMRRNKIRRSSSDMADVFLPSPIQEENSFIQEMPDTKTLDDQQYTEKPKTTLREIRSRLGRRYTTGEINIEGANFLPSSRNGHFHQGEGHVYQRGGRVMSHPDSSKLQFSEDLEQTKKVLAMCKKQLLEAKTGALPLSWSGSEYSMIPSHGENPVFKRERFEHLRQSVRQKAFRWRSSSGSVDE